MRLKESIGERPLEFPSNSLICWVKTLDRFVTDTSKSDGLGRPEARRSPPPEAGAPQPWAGMGYSCELAVFFLQPPHFPNLVPGFHGAVWRGKKVEDPLGVILAFRTPPPSYPVFPVCPPSFPAVPFPPIPCRAVLAPVGWGRLARHPEFAAIPDSLTSLRELELGED